MPATVIIPEGESEVSFDIASMADGIVDGDQTVTLTARATGFGDGSATLVVTDINRADLVVTSIEPGDYWIVVTADAADAVRESVEGNNTAIATAPIRLSAAYSAQAWADTEVSDRARGDHPVGPGPAAWWRARRVGAGACPHRVRGLKRVLVAQTDAQGDFTAVFNPLPGASAFPTQDEFTILGRRASIDQPSIKVAENSSVTGALVITNIGEVPLSGLAAVMSDTPANVSASVGLSTNALAGGGEVRLGYVLTAAAAPPLRGTVQVRLSSAEGAVLDVPIEVFVEPARARLSVQTVELEGGVLRGQSGFVEFQVANLGGAETGPIHILLPELPWLSLTATNPLPTLGADQTNRVALQLTPPNDLPLGPYRGTIVVTCEDDGVAVPFEFRVVSEAKGDLIVMVEDEFTYYAAGSPKLAGAEIIVQDAVTDEVVGIGQSDPDGRFELAELPEGYYRLEVEVDKFLPGVRDHAPSKSTRPIPPGERGMKEDWFAASFDLGNTDQPAGNRSLRHLPAQEAMRFSGTATPLVPALASRIACAYVGAPCE